MQQLFAHNFFSPMGLSSAMPLCFLDAFHLLVLVS